MSDIVLPPDESRKQLYDRAAVKPLKFLHSDGSVSAPDPLLFGAEILPPDPQRAENYERAAAEAVKYLFPDGSVRDGEGLTEGNSGGGGAGGGVNMNQVNNAITAHNTNAAAHADIRQLANTALQQDSMMSNADIQVIINTL